MTEEEGGWQDAAAFATGLLEPEAFVRPHRRCELYCATHRTSRRWLGAARRKFFEETQKQLRSARCHEAHRSFASTRSLSREWRHHEVKQLESALLYLDGLKLRFEGCDLQLTASTSRAALASQRRLLRFAQVRT